MTAPSPQVTGPPLDELALLDELPPLELPPLELLDELVPPLELLDELAPLLELLDEVALLELLEPSPPLPPCPPLRSSMSKSAAHPPAATTNDKPVTTTESVFREVRSMSRTR